jgi:hypothetical protein
MADSLVTLELRWFFDGELPATVQQWFDTALPGPAVEPAPRSDFYLIVAGRDDTGLKLREQKLELKIRSRSTPFVGDRVRARGRVELWEKWSWSYARPADVEIGFAEGVRGPRVDVDKVRWQRKYDASPSGTLRPVPAEESVERAALIEITRLRVLDRPAWTLGFDAIGPAPDREGILSLAVDVLLAAFPAAERLSSDRSFGYPRWLIGESGSR